jgi:hypothetical protein
MQSTLPSELAAFYRTAEQTARRDEHEGIHINHVRQRCLSDMEILSRHREFYTQIISYFKLYMLLLEIESTEYDIFVKCDSFGQVITNNLRGDQIIVDLELVCAQKKIDDFIQKIELWLRESTLVSEIITNNESTTISGQISAQWSGHYFGNKYNEDIDSKNPEPRQSMLKITVLSIA